MIDFIIGDEKTLILNSDYKPLKTAFVIVESAKGFMLLYNKYRKVWELTGGIIEPNETPDQCAVRECYEESNQCILKIKFLFLIKMLMKKNVYREHDTIEYAAIYHSYVDTIYNFKENDEIKDICWVKKENEIPQDICKTSLAILKKYNFK